MSVGHLLLLVESLKAQSLSHLLLLLKSQSSRTPRGKGQLLLPLKTKSSMTPRGKVHLLLQGLNLHPSTEQTELLPNTDRETHKPLPSTQHLLFKATKDSSSRSFFISG
jgi:hypothetical protein